ncbi:thioester reductase [Actinokineospora bangkokensis]|uniref:Thioester reductase n=1 Tax=Actinokineospora bangkokensis TaxID=1193682 RepID=A0A1Q9LSB5_9PSEU|nr:thioester reductase [Actinokineospora bangkokensis]
MPADDCLHTAFERCAARVPDRVAVSCGDTQLSYAELDAMADALALRLRRRGVAPGVRVGVCVDRSVELVVAVLAVLKAGGAYVPVDPDYPPARIALVLDDAAVALTVAVVKTADSLSAWPGPVLWTDDDGTDDLDAVLAVAEAVPGDAAYVIYTSGSTGTPKGVEVEHRSVVALLRGTAELFGFDDLDVWTLFHSIAFDFSVWELWGPLLHGCKVVVVPGDVARTPALVLDLLRRERVTVLSQTPTAFRGLVAADAAAGPPAELSLRLVVFGGERLDVGVLRSWIERRGDRVPELVNMYGITETTVHATHRRITAADLADTSVSPLGTALPGVRVEPRTAEGAPVPDGEPGELFVSGTGVARGYLGRPELTAERFVELDGTRWYRSGDRGAVVGGELVYLGRVDRQLKVRGYRVEPGEVEAALLACPRVGTAVVTTRDHGGGDVRLVAFVAPPPAADPVAPAEAELVAAVAHLPAHLRPSAFHVVDEVPTTARGKADLLALADAAERGELEPDATPVAVVAAIVAEVLLRPVAPDADLFDSGATSLALARIVAEVNDQFAVALTGAELTEPTIECLAAAADAARRAGALQGIGG